MLVLRLKLLLVILILLWHPSLLSIVCIWIRFHMYLQSNNAIEECKLQFCKTLNVSHPTCSIRSLCQAYCNYIGFLLEMYENFLIPNDARCNS